MRPLWVETGESAAHAALFTRQGPHARVDMPTPNITSAQKTHGESRKALATFSQLLAASSAVSGHVGVARIIVVVVDNAAPQRARVLEEDRSHKVRESWPQCIADEAHTHRNAGASGCA